MKRKVNAAEWIVQQCEHDPADNVDPHPDLFSDLDDDRLSDALFKLWRKGVVNAEWDEDEQATLWNLSHFGVEICERGLLRQYVEALENDIQIDAPPGAFVKDAEPRTEGGRE